MHHQSNYQRHVWLLTGTGDGFRLAQGFVEKGWGVTVSVVTPNAALPYSELPLEHLSVGPLCGVGKIKEFILRAASSNRRFDFVVDATHPFAEIISSDLKKACSEIQQPLLRFERPLADSSDAIIFNSFTELSSRALHGKNLLLALGSRHLSEAVDAASSAGANVFARVLPTSESLRYALASGIKETHIAVLRPFQGDQSGAFEASLCKRWSISHVVCRQSGGLIEDLWNGICKKQKLCLWMLARPSSSSSVEMVYSWEELLARTSCSEGRKSSTF